MKGINLKTFDATNLLIPFWQISSTVATLNSSSFAQASPI